MSHFMVGGAAYQCNRQLGNGAFGFVIMCNTSDDKDLIAIKFLRKKHETTQGVIDSLIHEKMILQKLAHVNIIKYIDLDDSHIEITKDLIDNVHMDTDLMIGLELCSYDFRTMVTKHYDHILVDNYPGSPNHVFVDIFYQIFNGIKYLHDSSIVCFDIKPENILVKHEMTGKLTFKLCDFGAALEFGELNGRILEKPRGTPYYIPWHLQRTTYFRDIYAFFCVMYFLFTKMVFDDPKFYNAIEDMTNPKWLQENPRHLDPKAFSGCSLRTVLTMFQKLEQDLIEANLTFKRYDLLHLDRYNTFYDSVFKELQTAHKTYVN